MAQKKKKDPTDGVGALARASSSKSAAVKSGMCALMFRAYDDLKRPVGPWRYGPGGAKAAHADLRKRRSPGIVAQKCVGRKGREFAKAVVKCAPLGRKCLPSKKAFSLRPHPTRESGRMSGAGLID